MGILEDQLARILAASFIVTFAIFGAMFLHSLLFGTLCLHISTGFMKFERRSLGRAFKTNFGLLVFSLVFYAVAYIAQSNVDSIPPLGRWVSIGIILTICFVPTLIIMMGYGCSFIAALVVSVLKGAVESALGTLLLIFLVVTLIAVAPESSKTDNSAEVKPHRAPIQVQVQTSVADNDQTLDLLVGKTFDKLQTKNNETLLDARVIRKENGKFVIRHKTGIARVNAEDILTNGEED